MKKIFLTTLLFFGVLQFTQSQINFGVKAGINYNSNSIKETGQDVFEGAKSKTGYHAGAWLRFKIPGLGLYLRPELVYTSLENEVYYKQTAETTNYDIRKLDIPVLLGKKIFSIGNIYILPSHEIRSAAVT